MDTFALLPLLRGWSVNNASVNYTLTSATTVDLFEANGSGALISYDVAITVPNTANLYGSLITLYTDSSKFNSFPLVFDKQQAAGGGPFTSYYITGSTTNTLYVFFNPSYVVPFRDSLLIQFTPPPLPGGGVVSVIGNVSYMFFDVGSMQASIGSLLSGILSNFRCS